MSDDYTEYMTQSDLLARIRTDRAAFAQLWNGLSSDQMTQRPGPQDDWSVKDLIAHITWWEKHMVERVTKLLNGQNTRRLQTVDEMNEEVFEENKDRTLDDVLAEFNSHQSILESLISSLSDAHINDPEVLTLNGEDSILGFLIGDTWGHYADHYDDLKRYVNKV